MRSLPLLAAALVLPLAATAQERTAGQAYDAQTNWAVLKGMFDKVDAQNKTLAAALNAVGTKLDAIGACGAQGKLWGGNGSACVAPAAATISAQVQAGTFTEANPHASRTGDRACARSSACSGWNPASDAYCKGRGYDALSSYSVSSWGKADVDNMGDSHTYVTYPLAYTIRCMRIVPVTTEGGGRDR